MKSYVVIGLGQFGSALARQLCSLGNEVLAVDRQADLVQKICGDVTGAVVADAGNQEALRALGVAEYDCAVVAIENDLSASILATMNLQELGVSSIVCQAQDEDHRRILLRLGADRVVIPEQDMAARVAQSLSGPGVMEQIERSGDCGIAEIPAPRSWVGKSLRELDVRAKLGVTVLAVKTSDGVKVSPKAEYITREEDIMVILGDNDALAVVQKQ